MFVYCLFLFYVYFISIYVCVVSVHMCVPVGAHGGQKRALCVFPYYSLLYSLEAGSLPETEAPSSWLGCSLPPSSCLRLAQYWGCRFACAH